MCVCVFKSQEPVPSPVADDCEEKTKKMKITFISLFFVFSHSTIIPVVVAFSTLGHARCLNKRSRTQVELLLARYGPKEDMPTDMNGDFFADQDEWERMDNQRVVQQKEDFKALIEKILAIENPEHLPGLMTRNLNFLLNMRGYEGSGLMKELLLDAEKMQDDEYLEHVSAAVDYVISFIEEFVDQAKSLDEENKLLLGKIIRAITRPTPSDVESSMDSSFEDDNKLDIILRKEKGNFTPGFIRHLEGECQRIEAAPRISPESSTMLQVLRMIQMRVLEELGQDLGDGALVLGQLLGYEDKAERLAVLDAGLAIRGIDFAHELVGLTKQALEDFQVVPGGVDASLVKIISEIDGRIRTFIAKTDVGNFE